jgi:hypothetical protein
MCSVRDIEGYEYMARAAESYERIIWDIEGYEYIA